jgi:hypothetical protein
MDNAPQAAAEFPIHAQAKTDKELPSLENLRTLSELPIWK